MEAEGDIRPRVRLLPGGEGEVGVGDEIVHQSCIGTQQVEASLGTAVTDETVICEPYPSVAF